jgi:hypothetical protein
MSQTGKAIDFVAAGIFAGAVAFAAFALAGGVIAVALAPIAFLLAYSGLRRVGADRLHALADFELAPLDAPRPPTETNDDKVVRLFGPQQLAIAGPSAVTPRGVHEDAGQALSDALAQLKRSLR